MQPKTLNQRLINTTVIIITLTSTLFAGGVLLLKQRLEATTFGDMVHEQLMVLIDEPQAEEMMTGPLFHDWHFYRGESAASLPESIQSLKAGVYHNTPFNGRHYHLQIVNTDIGKAYLFYDITDWENQEHLLLTSLVLGVLLVLLLAVFMASGMASKILEPVKRLTRRLSIIEPGQRGVRIGAEFSDSDIGQIAEAVDTYLERIDQFVERERSFSAAASHELRTPLSVMMGAVDIIERNQHDPVTLRAITRIRRACSDMHAFIEASLLLSREEDRSLKQKASSDLCQVASQLIEDLQPYIESAQISVHMDCQPAELAYVPESISKILMGNLLRNAIEHSDKGDVFLSVTPERLLIRDTGRGIAEADLLKVTERHYSTKDDGSGIGLYMVKRICEKYGWQMDLQSTLGKGTCVTVVFEH